MPIIGVVASSDRNVPAAPTIGTATNVPSGRPYNNGRADVTFTAPTYTGGSPITSYTVTSSPGGFTGTGASSPISVTGLQSNTAYTFTVTATNAQGTSAASAASNSITATTVPQAPTIGTATDGGTGTTVSVAFTAGATGGSAITGFTATSSPGSITGTGASSPITVSGLTTGTAYTFTVTATNANGTSTASAASNSVTPISPTAFESIATLNPTTGTSSVTFSSIPGTFKHLQIRCSTKFSQTSSADYTEIQLSANGTALTNGLRYGGNGTGNVVYIAGNTAGLSINNHSSAVSNYNPTIIDIYDYARTDKTKTIKYITGMTNNAYPEVIFYGMATYNSTSAITSLTLTNASAVSWITGTEFALYGIRG